MKDIKEAIQHCLEVIKSCDNTGCSMDHRQLADWLTELLYYRRIYGTMEKYIHKITLTSTNGLKCFFRVQEIIRVEPVEGVFNGVEYHSRVYLTDGNWHHYVETPEEIAKLIDETYECV